MSNNIIFIGGIHGAGKGTFCNKVKNSININHVSASDLIRWTEINDDPNNKFVKNIPGTQDLLLTGIKNNIEPDQYYLLDGHFSLLNSIGEVELVSENTFIQINPIMIVVVVAEINQIKNRLEVRDEKSYSSVLLEKMQEVECQHALDISKKLNTPFIKVSNDSFMDAIEEFRKRSYAN